MIAKFATALSFSEVQPPHSSGAISSETQGAATATCSLSIYIDRDGKCSGILDKNVSAYITGSNSAVKKFFLFFQAGKLITENHL